APPRSCPPRRPRGGARRSSTTSVFFFLLLIARMCRLGGRLVDAAFGQRCQLLVRRLFFIECFLEQCRGFRMTHATCPRHKGSVRGHLVVLGSLSGGDQASVHGRLVEILPHDRFPFVDDARNTVAVFALDLLVKELEHLFKPFDMPARLLEVRLEGGPQVFRSRPLGQPRQRFGQLFFGAARPKTRRAVCPLQPWSSPSTCG